jgi:DNA-binding response OmpR family regulator
MTARYYLEAAGYQVLEAGTGSEALGVSRSHSGAIDILLTDMVLPELNGTEVAQQITVQRQDIRVLFMSAHDPVWLVEQGRLAPGASSLQKPFTAEELVQTLHDILNQS